MKKKIVLNTGQALISLLFFISIAVTITTAAVVIILTSSDAVTKFEEGSRVYYVAEAGLENGLMRLLRDPSYTGETMTVDDGAATITVTGTNPYTIQSKGTVGNFIRTIEVTAQFSSGSMSVSNWREI